ncbi:MAG: tRNA 2-thiouridine(34) synthase MnmA [Lachnospiraceae bacterium]|nr:tRNA 2-thiouridine(34) synthase MnmA [Lachnospiraceae bacterium]
MRVIVGMSGGVDSAVTAYLLKMKGYEVIGVTLRIVNGENEVSRCCEIDDARQVCETLGIPYYVHNCSSKFAACVIDPFIQAYSEGRTPNPCVNCNRLIKWDELMRSAEVLQADYIATGHYAKIEQLPNGRYTVKNAASAQKDQSYMLCRLSQEQLAKTLMPLGDLTKDEVRKIAEVAGLHVATKAESQDICFVPDGDYAAFIEERTGKIFPEGDFVDTEGKVLGQHKGIINYTVGQRKGLGVAAGIPIFVMEIDAEQNKVVLTNEDGMYALGCILKNVNYMGMEKPEENVEFDAWVKVRYHHKAIPAKVQREGMQLFVVFSEPVKAVAPGQTGVLYDENGCVLAGGEIDR